MHQLSNEQVKRIRLFLDLTQEQFAEKLGVSVSTIKFIETNRMAVSARVATRIAKLFQPTEEYFQYLQNYRKLSGL